MSWKSANPRHRPRIGAPSTTSPTQRLARFRSWMLNAKTLPNFNISTEILPIRQTAPSAVLSKMFNLAEVWGLRPGGSNPCRPVPNYREETRERFLNQKELKLLGPILNAAEQDGTKSPSIGAEF